MILSVNLEVPVEYEKSHIESQLKQCIPYAVRVGSSLVLHFTVTSDTSQNMHFMSSNPHKRWQLGSRGNPFAVFGLGNCLSNP